MTLNELFAVKPQTNRITWRKRKGDVEKSYEIDPKLNYRNHIEIVKDKDNGGNN